MPRYSISVDADSRTAVQAAIDSLRNKVKVIKTDRESRIVFETDQDTADLLSTRTGKDVKKVVYASTGMGMENQMLRVLAERNSDIKSAEPAILMAKLTTVPPINGQPAERYMARTQSVMAISSGWILQRDIKDLGLRIYANGTKNLSVIFFDATSPEQVKAVPVPQEWAITKLTP